LLLIWAICLLPFTYSRAGLLNLIAVLLIGMLLFGTKQLRETQKSPGVKRYRLWLRLGQIGAVLVLAGASIFFIGSRNSFFARMWGYWKKPGANLYEYMSYIGFDARLIYAQAAFNTYTAHPFLGVGLGNYAFYFEDMLPYRPIAEVPEILLMITPELGRDRLITSKNFYLRILAETGIMGAVTFGVFLLVDLGYALYLWLSPEKEWSYWGTASICGLIAFALSAFTFDSFVIPNMWVLLGLITAATRLSARAELLFSKNQSGTYEPLLEPS
jgi:O-antigen ligase